MKKQLEKRLADLEQEMETGKAKMEELDAQKNQLTNTLLRISGAIQVLKEELGQDEASDQSEIASK